MNRGGKTVCAVMLMFLLWAHLVVSAQTDPVPATSAPQNTVTQSSDEELILDEPAPAPSPAQKKTAPSSLDSAAAAKATSAKGATAPKNTPPATVDEELILDGGAEDLLGHERPAPTQTTAKKVQADSAGMSVDSSKAGSIGQPAMVEQQNAADTTPAAILPRPEALASKPTVEKTRSINFGANLKEYRSPKLAMLMSLIVPGAGQVYARSNWVAAAFLAVEAVVFGTGYAFIAQSKSQKKKARAYADSCFSLAQYEKYYGDLTNYLVKELGTDKADSVLIDVLFFGDTTGARTLLDNARRKNDLFYDDLTNSSSLLVRGWKDVEPEFTAEDGFENIDTLRFKTVTGPAPYLVTHRGKNDVAFGFSNNQLTYVDMINQSRSLARTGKGFYMSLLVNHIASAVIAGILAKKHNDALLGQESVWQRIDVEQQMVNTGSHTVTGYAVGLRF